MENRKEGKKLKKVDKKEEEIVDNVILTNKGQEYRICNYSKVAQNAMLQERKA